MAEHPPKFEISYDELPASAELNNADNYLGGLNPEYVEWRTVGNTSTIIIPWTTFQHFSTASNYTSPGTRIWNLLEKVSQPDHVDSEFFGHHIVRDENGSMLGVRPHSIGAIIDYVEEYHVPGFREATVGRLRQVQEWVQTLDEPDATSPVG